jgi:hypothetical protein
VAERTSHSHRVVARLDEVGLRHREHLARAALALGIVGVGAEREHRAGERLEAVRLGDAVGEVLGLGLVEVQDDHDRHPVGLGDGHERAERVARVLIDQHVVRAVEELATGSSTISRAFGLA